MYQTLLQRHDVSAKVIGTSSSHTWNPDIAHEADRIEEGRKKDRVTRDAVTNGEEAFHLVLRIPRRADYRRPPPHTFHSRASQLIPLAVRRVSLPGPPGKAVETAPMAAAVTSCERIMAYPCGVGCCKLFGLQLDNVTPQNTLGLEVWQQVAVYQTHAATTPLCRPLCRWCFSTNN